VIDRSRLAFTGSVTRSIDTFGARQLITYSVTESLPVRVSFDPVTVNVYDFPVTHFVLGMTSVSLVVVMSLRRDSSSLL
jgi:hypothetical protein